ncbi:hypothetical protein OsI_37501 [Oryza sativa Indica Group]|uniref:ACT domain-containing protein ACR n=1 Tax=Oryza sativa subsp. indica TaxID=39946 RepID=A2ZI57_ORYSI|nr:hypothetical protein OsI_37501 [Oryza sativa Indica Group]
MALAAAAAAHHLVAPAAVSPYYSARVSPGFLRLHDFPRSVGLAATAAPRIFCQSINSADVLGASSTTSDDAIPQPVVLIDQDSDRDATIVQLSFGDRLGALLDTESSENLAMGEFFGIKAPEKKVDVDVVTHVIVEDDGPKRSMLYIETADRPGLLLEIVKIITDVNVDVESAEIDTEGLVAKDKFHVSYRGAKLNSSLSQDAFKIGPDPGDSAQYGPLSSPLVPTVVEESHWDWEAIT